jgi:hypothetical protein
MENRESQIFINSEVKENISKAEKHVNETKAYLDSALQTLQESLDNLQVNIDNLSRMTEGNEFSNDYKNTTGKETKTMSYPPEVIEKVKRGIELSEKTVAEAKSLVADLILEDVQANTYKEKLEKLNQKFKDDLLKLESFNLN